MKATYLLPIFMVGLLFSSCSDNDPGDIDIGSGQDATIKFTFKLPPSPKQTRADIPGNAVENEIDGIMIYVYDQSGNPPSNPERASFGPLTLDAHFTQDAQNENIYTMNDPVTTTAGNKHIYVVANAAISSTPTNDLGAFGSQDQLLGRQFDVHKGTEGYGLINYNAATPPAVTHIVFAGNTTKELIPASPGQTNEVEIEIERAVSRVITTSANPQVFTGFWTEGNEYRMRIVNFLVKQDAYKGVVGQNYFAAPNNTWKKTLISETQQTNWYDVINPYQPSDYLEGTTNNIDDDYIPIVADPGEAQRVNLAGFYIGENVTKTPDQEAQHGNTTYAWIQTRLELDNTAVMNGAGDGIEYTGAGLDGTETFHLIRVRGVQDYICHPDNSEDVARHLHQTFAGDVATHEFPFGYIYYRVFLNGVGPDGQPLPENDRYNVYRNQFIHLDITNVILKGEPRDPDDPTTKPGTPGGFGPGYPGNTPDDPNDPDDPGPKVPVDPFTPPDIDPEDPTKPGTGPRNNPNPHLPEEPIDEKDATLTVNITIKLWEYMHNGIVLE